MTHPAGTSSDPTRADPAPRPRTGPGPGPAYEDRELDHRLANSLQLATDFLLFEQLRLRDPAARAALAEAAARLSAVGQLHRFLSAHGEAASIDMEAFLGELGGLIARSTGLTCEVEADPVALPGVAAQQLGIAINEIAMNAAKHGYPSGETGLLRIESRREGDRLRLTVSDDGAGLGRGFQPDGAHGLGMSIVQAIVRQLHGVLEAHDDDGARFTIALPLGSPAGRVPRSFAPADRRP